jgi:anti-sigma factor RsiW
MTSFDVWKKLSRYIDGMIEDKMRGIIEEHLDSCKACSEELEGLRMAIEGLKSMQEVEMTEDF